MTTRPDRPSAPMPWDGWGPPVPLPAQLRALLEARLGLTIDDTLATLATTAADLPAPPPSRLPGPALARLTRILGADGLDRSDLGRHLHAAGRSTTDLIRLRAGSLTRFPDAVLTPATHDQTLSVLRMCSDLRIAVIPFGGGTSVVGGVEPAADGFPAVVTLDLRAQNKLLDVDPLSQTATVQAGMTGPDVETALRAEGFALGHLPQSFQHATIGGFAATRSAGQASSGYGRFDEMVQRLRVATPRGTLDLGRPPASAAGPDLRQLMLGSEGVFGVISDVTVRVHAEPDTTVFEAWTFRDFPAGTAAMRSLSQANVLPTVARLSDESETALTSVLDPVAVEAGRVVAVTIYEGTRDATLVSQQAVRRLLTDAGGTSIGPDVAHHWHTSRFHAPYLRDAVLRVGGFVETVETAATWSALPQLYEHTKRALSVPVVGGQPAPIVTCHISHLYTTGASLYFTVLAAPGDDAISWWHHRKQAASQAIIRNGGTITHHHGVGLQHLPWMPTEIGDLGVEILHAIKATLDPAGILNPGKLVPNRPSGT